MVDERGRLHDEPITVERVVWGKTAAYVAMTCAAVICAGCGLFVAYIEAAGLAGCLP